MADASTKRPSRFRAAWALVALACLFGSPSTAAAQPEARAAAPALAPIPVFVSIAEDEKGPVRDAEWVDAQLARAEQLFAPFGFHFKKVGVKSLGPTHLHLETRQDRDDLALKLEKGALNVMVVGTLRDVDEPDRMRMGVHWRKRTDARKRYVIVAADARQTTLAHEMGHFFGCAHTTVVDNLMSYERSGGEVFVDAVQGKTMVRMAKLAFAGRELRVQ